MTKHEEIYYTLQGILYRNLNKHYINDKSIPCAIRENIKNESTNDFMAYLREHHSEFLKSENEVGVSDACSKHGVSPRVGERNVSGDPSQSSIASEQRALDNRIEDEIVCRGCKQPLIDEDAHRWGFCFDCLGDEW